ncbi:MAG: lipid-A-disaccharide synthase, partial [Leptotrichiaceae bacterium]
MINRNKKVFVSCGEMSGDLHLSYIMEEIKLKSNDIEFHGVVGDKSIAAGAIAVQHIKDNDIMGFYEVVKKIKYFKDKINQYIDYIVANDIKTVIFVDYGGFNLKFFEILKKKVPDIYTIYYIPPKVWAWGKRRIEKLKKFDEVIVIFPFEKEYFDKEKMNVKYFGNPFVDKYIFSNQLGDSILLLPGSRKQEIKSAVPIFLELVKNKPNEKFILKLATEEHKQYLSEKWLRLDNLIISLDSFDKIRDQLKYGISTSGTVTFELALMGLPQIV